MRVQGGFELQTVSADCKHLWGRGLGSPALLKASLCLGLSASHELLSEPCPALPITCK